MLSVMPLLLYIPFHNTLRNLMTYRPNIIAITPKLAAPEFILHLRMYPKYLLRRKTFQNLCNTRGRILWERSKKQMNVIPVCPQCIQFKLISGTNFCNHLFHRLIDALVKQQILPILHNPNKMIPKIKTGMCSRLNFSHTHKDNLSQQFYGKGCRFRPPLPIPQLW